MPAPQPQTPAPTPAPVQAPAPTQTGGVPEPEPYVPPVPASQEDDPLLPPGYSYTAPTDRAYTMVMPFRPGARYAYGPDGDRIEVGGDPDYEPRSFPMGPEENTSAPAPAPEPVFTPPPANGFFPGVTPDFSNLDFSGLSDLNLEDLDFSNLPDFQMPAPTMPAPQAQAPAPVYTPPPSQIPMQGMMDDYDFGNPNLRNMGRSGPRR